jgi:hypothetical protein
LEEELAGMSAEDVFRHFANRLAKRAAASSQVRVARHAAYGTSSSSPDVTISPEPKR